MEEKMIDVSELKASSLYVKKTKDSPQKTAAASRVLIPAGYVQVKLSSMGMLGLPAVIHVRDYTFEEALRFSSITEQNQAEVLISIVKAVTYEEIQSELIHVQDMMEIFLTILGTWYSPNLETYRYYIDLDLPKEERDKPGNISVAVIPINSIKTTPLKHKLPITISDKATTVSFGVQTLWNEIVASVYLEEKYALEAQELAVAKQHVLKDTATAEEMKQYSEYLSHRGADYFRVTQAQLILAVNGTPLETLDEQIAAMSEVSLSIWKQYRATVESAMRFGIDPEVTFDCTVNHTQITRRFRFRYTDFLPPMDPVDSGNLTVSFG